MATLKDWYHFIRPNLWIYIIAIYLIGFFLSQGTPLLFLIGAVVFILINTASITVNHYYDAETDKLSHQKRFPVAEEKISRQFAMGFSLAILSASFVLAAFFFPLPAFLLTLFSGIMIFAYSAPPVRIKGRPFIETFWNALGYGTVPFYLSLLIFQTPISIPIHILGFIPLLISASGHILLQVRDITADESGKLETTSTRLGLKTMVRVSKGMIGIAGLFIVYLTLTSFLSPLAWISLLTGGLIYLEHRRMKTTVTKSYPILKILYLIGGISFIASVF